MTILCGSDSYLIGEKSEMFVLSTSYFPEFLEISFDDSLSSGIFSSLISFYLITLFSYFGFSRGGATGFFKISLGGTFFSF